MYKKASKNKNHQKKIVQKSKLSKNQNCLKIKIFQKSKFSKNKNFQKNKIFQKTKFSKNQNLLKMKNKKYLKIKIV